MMPNFFKPKGGYFGAQLVSTEVSLGTGATAVADTATTSVLLPKPSCTTCQLMSLTLTGLVAAVSAGQTVTVQVFKRDNSGTPADRTLTATKSITSSIIATADKSYPIAITSTSIQNLTFQASDAARIDAVASGTVSTAPVVTISALWAIVQP